MRGSHLPEPMLAATVEAAGRHGDGSVAVVCLADDDHASNAVSAIRSELREPNRRLRHVTLETIVEAAVAIEDLAGWANRFRRRYLTVDLPDTPDAGADPDGPRFGKALHRP